MAVDERSRHELYRRLEDVLGPEAATTLIEHLPPVGWADVATKHDLAALEQRMELRFDRIDDRFDRIDDRFGRNDDRFAALDDRFAALDDRISAMGFELRASFEHELRAQTTTMVFALVSVVLTMAALAFALARFT
jgi:hypothetical protein